MPPKQTANKGGAKPTAAKAAAPKPASTTPAPKAKPATTDSRFTAARHDPRFKMQKAAPKTKAKVDERFQAMFDSEEFKQTEVQSFTSAKGKNAKADLEKLYDTSSLKSKKQQQQQMDDESDEDEEEGYTADDIDSEDEEALQNAVLAAGEDESSTEIGTTDDEDEDEEELEELPEGLTHGSIRGSYATLVDQPTKRLALYNMEWEQLRAVDILAVMRSFCPPGGQIFSCAVYPSKFGLEMMEREKRGDFTLWSEAQVDDVYAKVKAKKLEEKQKKMKKKGGGNNNKKKQQINLDESDEDIELSDTEIDRALYGEDEEDIKVIQANQKRLQEYELGKLRYYYAIITCDSADTAFKLYQDVDGLEYEASSNIFDLRFVPDEHQFDEKTLRDRATVVPPGHIPPNYVTNCLTSTQVDCTWEREDPRRARLLQQDFTKEDYNVDDLTAFLANDSEEEGFATDVPVSETDSDPSSNDDDDNSDDNGDDSDNQTTLNGKKIMKKSKLDSLAKERVVATKVVDGKKKRVLSLKRRARNEFADILAEIHDDKDAKKKSSDKQKILNKANKALQKGSDDDEDNNNDDGDDDESEEEEQQEDLKKKQKKKPSIVLQSALSTFAQNISENKKKNDEEERLSRLSVWQRQLEQQKLKKEQKKAEKKRAEIEANIDQKSRVPVNANEGSLYDDNVLDMNDPFFKDMDMKDIFDEKEFGQVDPNAPIPTTSKKAKNTKKVTMTDDITTATTTVAAQAADDGNSDDDDGYNVSTLVKKNKIKQLAIDNKKKSKKDIEEQLINQALGMDEYEQRSKVQLTEKDVKRAAYIVNKTDAGSKKKQKITADDILAQQKVQLDSTTTTTDDNNKTKTTSGDFKINLKDERFAAVFEDADFGLDTTSGQFMETEGTTQLLAETQRRRREKQKQQEQLTKKRKFGGEVKGDDIDDDMVTVNNKNNTNIDKKQEGLSDELQSLVGRVKVVSKLNKMAKRK